MLAPQWNDTGLNIGTMVRAALWLTQAVGKGNTFTKEQLRDAFPGVSQVDRRLRDLRRYGWVIDTNTSDASLAPNEQRFVEMGVAVWDPKQRRAASQDPSLLTNKERAEIFASDGFQCVACGIAGGERYPDRRLETAVLSVSRKTLRQSNGTEVQLLATECKRCRSGFSGSSISIFEVSALLDDLSDDDLERLKSWVSRGCRGATPVDRAWNALYRLPAPERLKLLNLPWQPRG